MPHASIPGVCGFTHQPTTPAASLATPQEPLASLGFMTMDCTPATERLSTWYFRKSATFFSLSRLPCSNQKRVMSMSPDGLSACQRHNATTYVLWLSSGSAPTVLASTSVVRTSHSLRRLGYVFAELSLRSVCPPTPSLTAWPFTSREQPARIVTSANTAIRTAVTRLLALIWRSRSIGERVPSRRHTH